MKESRCDGVTSWGLEIQVVVKASCTWTSKQGVFAAGHVLMLGDDLHVARVSSYDPSSRVASPTGIATVK